MFNSIALFYSKGQLLSQLLIRLLPRLVLDILLWLTPLGVVTAEHCLVLIFKEWLMSCPHK